MNILAGFAITGALFAGLAFIWQDWRFLIGSNIVFALALIVHFWEKEEWGEQKEKYNIDIDWTGFKDRIKKQLEKIRKNGH